MEPLRKPAKFMVWEMDNVTGKASHPEAPRMQPTEDRYRDRTDLFIEVPHPVTVSQLRLAAHAFAEKYLQPGESRTVVVQRVGNNPNGLPFYPRVFTATMPPSSPSVVEGVLA